MNPPTFGKVLVQNSCLRQTADEDAVRLPFDRALKGGWTTMYILILIEPGRMRSEITVLATRKIQA